MRMLTIFGLFSFLFVLSNAESEECLPRKFEGGIVCVCNVDHCDIIKQVKKVEAGKFLTYTSNKDGLRFKKEIGDINNKHEKAKYKIKIRHKSYQEIFGFGGALTDSSCLNILSLEESLQDAILRSYFSENGSEYNIVRLPMGSTDFSKNPYTYHDTPDMSLSNFSLVPEDTELKIPMIKRIQDLNLYMKIFVSTWTAPLWMKVNGAYAGIFGFLKFRMYPVWANYFIKFLDAYKEHNITMWAISTGNEPSTGLSPVKVPSVGWLSFQMRYWVSQYLGPSLRNSAHSDIKLIALDDQRFLLPRGASSLFKDEKAKNYIDGLAVHWYLDWAFSKERLSETHDLYPDKFLIATEACLGSSGPPHVLLGSWERGEKYAHSVIEDLNRWLVGWLDWNLVLDMTGGPTYIGNFVDSPIIVNAKEKEFYKQPMYYALAHFSKFVPRGSVRIDASGIEDKNVGLVAFKRPDNGIVVVILNKNDNEMPTQIHDAKAGKINLKLSKRSITTILYWP